MYVCVCLCLNVCVTYLSRCFLQRGEQRLLLKRHAVAVVEGQGIVGHCSHVHSLQCVDVLHDVACCHVHAIIMGLGGEKDLDENDSGC